MLSKIKNFNVQSLCPQKTPRQSEEKPLSSREFSLDVLYTQRSKFWPILKETPEGEVLEI